MFTLRALMKSMHGFHQSFLQGEGLGWGRKRQQEKKTKRFNQNFLNKAVSYYVLFSSFSSSIFLFMSGNCLIEAKTMPAMPTINVP